MFSSLFIIVYSHFYCFFHFSQFHLVFLNCSFILLYCTVRLSIGYFDTFAYDSALFPFSLDVSFVVPVLHLSHSTQCLPSPAISCYPSSALTPCSLPETFTAATTLETSTRLWSTREGWREGSIPRTFPRRISSTWIGEGAEAYHTDSRYCRLQSEFFYRYVVCFPLFSDKYFPGL